MERHVFFTDGLGAGGISTNVVALSSYVASVGARPIIVPISARRHSNIWEYCEQFADVISPVRFVSLIRKSKSENYVFFINSIRTLLIAYFILFLSAFKKNKVKLVFCVYNPWEFSQKGYWPSLYRRLIFTIGKNNIFFMDGACYEDHASACPNGSIKPIFLPLVMPKVLTSDHGLYKPERKNVLTVGRFVGFKLHYMRALLQYAYVRTSIDFYFVGYGEGESELRLFVSQNNLKNVSFLGAVQYEELHSLYQDANCYVGMGTTLVEASSVGTPCVVAVVGMPGDVCYGLFVNQTEYDMGEFRANKPTYSLTDCLDYLLDLDQEEFKSLSEQHRAFSKQFAIDVVGPLYLRLCDSAKETFLTFKTASIWFWLGVATGIYYLEWGLRGKKSRYDKPYL